VPLDKRSLKSEFDSVNTQVRSRSFSMGRNLYFNLN
jgi:hypothetical protein